MKVKNIVISVCFFLVLGIGFISYLVIPDKKYSEDENRYLAEMPKFSLNSLLSGKFTSQMEDYCTDQFVCRSQAITGKTLVQQVALVKDSNGVYFGKDGSLMLKKTPSEFEEKRFKNNLSAIDSFAKLHDKMPVSVILAPTAASIWSYKLPSGAKDYNQQEKLEDARAYLVSNKNISFVNTYTTLKAHQKERLYYTTDHHWTTKGAYYCYAAWCEAMGKVAQELKEKTVSKSFYGTLYSKVLKPGIRPDSIEEFIPEKKETIEVSHQNGKTVSNSLYAKEKLNIKDKYQYFLGGNDGELSITTDIKNGRHLLLIKDSYANSFVPFLTSEYESIHMIDLRYFSSGLSSYMESKGINEVLILYNLNNFDEDSSIIKLQMP